MRLDRTTGKTISFVILTLATTATKDCNTVCFRPLVHQSIAPRPSRRLQESFPNKESSVKRPPSWKWTARKGIGIWETQLRRMHGKHGCSFAVLSQWRLALRTGGAVDKRMLGISWQHLSALAESVAWLITYSARTRPAALVTLRPTGTCVARRVVDPHATDYKVGRSAGMAGRSVSICPFLLASDPLLSGFQDL
jgi:hypothetical protein